MHTWPKRSNVKIVSADNVGPATDRSHSNAGILRAAADDAADAANDDDEAAFAGTPTSVADLY